jgi:hypothetical protein
MFWNLSNLFLVEVKSARRKLAFRVVRWQARSADTFRGEMLDVAFDPRR